VVIFKEGLQVIDALKQELPDAMILDIELPDVIGLEILELIYQESLPVTTIVLTSHNSYSNANKALELRAFDFLEKPCSKQRFRVTVKNAIEHGKLLEKVETYSNEFDLHKYHGFIGSSLKMQIVYGIKESAAKCYASVFITGESGTGKEVCAHANHNSSNKKDKPFVALNCAAIPKDLFKSEFFGHIKGAFSGAVNDRIGAFEMAADGTLFLDEICELDLSLQAKLLRFLQSGTYQRVGDKNESNVCTRIVCATNRDPEKEIEEGRFREDLYYRLNVFPIEMPALRDREEDILVLSRYFLEKFSNQLGKGFKEISPELEKAFMGYEWAGNIRELESTLENAIILNDSKVLELEMLPVSIRKKLTKKLNSVNSGKDGAGNVIVEKKGSSKDVMGMQVKPFWLAEKQIIKSAIENCDGNVHLAGDLL